MSDPIYVVCHRDPDSSNEYLVFGDDDNDPRIEIYDVDYGYADLRSVEEFAEWRESHLERAAELLKKGDRASTACAGHIAQAVADAMDNYGHTEEELREHAT